MAELIGGSALAGAGVGIVVLDTRHPLMRGNLQHAESFARPVSYEIVGISEPERLMAGDPSVAPLIVEAGERLLRRGVGIVAGACGSFVYYQRAVAAALPVPVFLSVMMAVPMLLASLGPERKLGVIASARSAINDRSLAACGVAEPGRLSVHELKGTGEFDRILAQEDRFDPDKLRREVVAVAGAAVRADPRIGAFVIQCSDIPPFSRPIREATGRPCFDGAGLIDWLAAAALPPDHGAR